MFPPPAANARSGNGLVYALWCVGFIGSVASQLNGWNGAIANRDFVSFWVAGKMALSGHAAQAYDVQLLRETAKSLVGTNFAIAFPYPPHILFVAVPLAFLPLKLSFFLWQAASAALFYFAAVLTPAAVINVTFGQVGFLYGALWLFAFGGSALAAAMLTFKPHLGFLAGVEVVKRRRLIATCLMAIVIIALSAAVFGVETWRASLVGAATQQFNFMSAGAYPNWYHKMVTPYLGFGLFGWIVCAVAAACLLTRSFTAFTAATAAFLIAPYGFHYDMTVVCLGFGLLLFERWREMPAWRCLVCSAAFVSPILVLVGTWLVPPVLLAGLYVQTSESLRKQESDA